MGSLLEITSSDPIVDTILATWAETGESDGDLDKDVASVRENLALLLPRRYKKDGADMAGWWVLWSCAQ